MYYSEVLQINAVFQHSTVSKAQSAYLGTEGIIIGITTAGLFLDLASTLCLWLDSVEMREAPANYRLAELKGRNCLSK